MSASRFFLCSIFAWIGVMIAGCDRYDPNVEPSYSLILSEACEHAADLEAMKLKVCRISAEETDKLDPFSGESWSPFIEDGQSLRVELNRYFPSGTGLIQCHYVNQKPDGMMVWISRRAFLYRGAPLGKEVSIDGNKFEEKDRREGFSIYRRIDY